MKLIIFVEKDNEECEKQTDSILKLTQGNLLSQLPKERLDNIDEDIQVMITNLVIDRQIKTKITCPIIFNRYSIKTYPTTAFLYNEEVVFKWEHTVPNVEEVVQSVKNYIKLLKLEEIDYNYDPEE